MSKSGAFLRICIKCIVSELTIKDGGLELKIRIEDFSWGKLKM